MDVLLFAGISWAAFVVALLIVIGIPVAYLWGGAIAAKRLAGRVGRRFAFTFLVLFVSAPPLFWSYEWSQFQHLCRSVLPTQSVRATTSANGVAFDLGYPRRLLPYFANGGLSSNVSSFQFAESRRDPSWYFYDIGNQLFERCYSGKRMPPCEFVELPQAEYLIKGGDIQPVRRMLGQFESVLQVVKIQDQQVSAERRVSLFGGDILGLFIGFSTGSQYVACNAGETSTYPWFGRQKTTADVNRNNSLVERDVQFVLSSLQYARQEGPGSTY